MLNTPGLTSNGVLMCYSTVKSLFELTNKVACLESPSPIEFITNLPTWSVLYRMRCTHRSREEINVTTFPMPKTLKLKRYRSWMHIFLHVRGAPTLFFLSRFLFGRFSFVGCLIPVGMRRAPFRLGYAICNNDVSVLAMPLIYVEKQATAPLFCDPGKRRPHQPRRRAGCFYNGIFTFYIIQFYHALT